MMISTKICALAGAGILIFAHLIPSSGAAHAALPPYPENISLNKVFLQLNKEQWVTTTTANVIVSIDATLDRKNIANTKKQILNNLTKISNQGPWYITLWEQGKDASGLEKLHAQAEARLPEQALNPLNEMAKNVSKPGETYKITNIDFSPNLAETEAVNAQLRSALYESAKKELQRLNAQYSEQKFYLHEINFSSNVLPLGAEKAATPMMLANGGTSVASSSSSDNNMSDKSRMSVSTKITLNANITLAAK